MDTAIIGIIVGIVVMMVMVIKTRIPVALAMVIGTIIMGLFASMAPVDLINAIQTGFGNVLGGIGLIIAFGVIMGACFEHSGGAMRMAKTFVKVCGKGREDIALGFTGLLVSIPVFCDSAYILLNPLMRAISRNTGKSAVGLGVSLALGLVITHILVPPTPGPLAVASILEVNIGTFIIWGLILAVPMFLVTLIYIRRLGEEYYRIPHDDDWLHTKADWAKLEYQAAIQDKDLPSNLLAFSPIFVPIILIILNTALSGGDTLFHNTIQLVGSPVVAVGIGVLIALYGLTRHIDREEIVSSMDHALSTAGLVLVVTGCAGAMGMVLTESGAGPRLAELIVSSGIPPIFVPLAIGSILRVIQGSSTAAMIIAATLTLPLVEDLGLDRNFVALACALGSLGFGHLNDSYFHIINRTLGMSRIPDQLMVWTVTTTIAWGVGATILLALNLFFGSGGTVIDPFVPLIILVVIVLSLKIRNRRKIGSEPQHIN